MNIPKEYFIKHCMMFICVSDASSLTNGICLNNRNARPINKKTEHIM